MRVRSASGLLLLAGAWLLAVGVMALPRLVPAFDTTAGSRHFLFWLVAIAASLCALTALGLGIVAHRQNLPELSYLSLWFLALSILPLAHGLTTPGVLYEDNASFNSTIFLAGPMGALVAAPIWIRGRFGAAVSRLWRAWYPAAATAIVALASVLLAWPNLIVTPAATSAWMIVATAPAVAISIWYSARHLRFTIISGRRRHLFVFGAFVLTGASYLAWISPAMFGTTFWIAHVFDIAGVFFGTIGAMVIYWKTDAPPHLFGPALAADPLAALDLGLDPNVDVFLARLAEKDEITRDHVLRTAESAVQVATALKLPATVVRDVGIGAVLHDIGKIAIPDEVLHKPGQLDDAEFDLMKTHTIKGFEMLDANRGLRGAAPIVRAHHERLDGRGYPDGLTEDKIPLPAKVVAVCDAFDAMAHDRPYRKGMPTEKAVTVLLEHAGSQWDGAVIAALVTLVEAGRIRTRPTLLDHLGEGAGEWFAHASDESCVCADALPNGVLESVA